MRKKMTPYFFTMPYFICYFAFGLFPAIFALYISFTNWNGIGTKSFIGIQNYIKLFTIDPYFTKSLINTLILMLEYIPFVLVFSLLLANLLFSKHILFRHTFQLFNFLPYIITPVAVGLIFIVMFDSKIGVVNLFLIKIGLLEDGINWLGKVGNARTVLGGMLIWKFIGYHMVMYLAALANIPIELREAAIIDGASAKDVFLHIVVPLLKPVILFLLITDIIYGFQLLEEPMLLFTSWSASSNFVGGPERSCLTVMWNLYDTAFGSKMDYGLGCAISYTLFLLTSVFSLIGFRIYNRGSEGELS